MLSDVLLLLLKHLYALHVASYSFLHYRECPLYLLHHRVLLLQLRLQGLLDLFDDAELLTAFQAELLLAQLRLGQLHAEEGPTNPLRGVRDETRHQLLDENDAMLDTHEEPEEVDLVVVI